MPTRLHVEVGRGGQLFEDVVQAVKQAKFVFVAALESGSFTHALNTLTISFILAGAP